MADFWNTDWLTRSDMFAPLRRVGSKLPAIGWPDASLLNALAEEAGRIVNAQGQRLRFVPQVAGPKAVEEGFEARTFLKGELQVRPLDWHDLFNALVWMTFPTAKAAINARHHEIQFHGAEAKTGGQRPPQADALTLFDEDGIVILSSEPDLLKLVREFRWKELFWSRRGELATGMRFFLFGHALYHKALDPFVGMTGKGILLQVPGDFFTRPLAVQVAEADRRLALYLWDRGQLRQGRDLSPLPALGVPGWHPPNEQAEFYDDASYFRPGRRRSDPDQGASPSM